jgi:sec-independent protein translocase protein TatA
MPSLGPLEIIVILLLALIFFGAKRLPELGKGLGNGIREFKKASKDIRSELEGSFNDEPAKPIAQTPAPVSSEQKL